MNRKILITANWKCNPITQREAEGLLREIKKGIRGIKNIEVVISTPFIYLPILLEKILGKRRKRRGNTLKAGAQDCFWENSGAYTGEVSPLMLKDLGVEYVILGHSERRKYFGETNETIAKKTKAVLKNKLSPILCIGETKEKRNNKQVEKVLKGQLREALSPITEYRLTISNLSITYEPVWSIGTGNFCPPDEAKNALMFIRKELIKVLPKEMSQNIRILYGGSVNSKNARRYIDAGFRGFLIGGASLIPQEFIKIIKLCGI